MFRRFLPIPENTPVSLILYGVLLAFLYGIIASAQILGLFGLFLPLLSIFIPLLLMYLIARLYFAEDNQSFFQSFSQSRIQLNKTQSKVDRIFLWAGVLLFLALFFFPLAAWPYSYISETLTWDAGLYHFPKAIELFRTGSFWDLSIPYGQYPLGYESLLAWSLTLTGSEVLFGVFHALIASFAYLTIWLLVRRYTHLPKGLLAFLTTLLLFSGYIQFTGNPWSRFASVIHTIGKNDLFLAAAVLAVILHAPLSRDSKPATHPQGLALASMVALSIKPNSLLIVAAAWLYYIYTTRQAGHTIPRNTWINYALLMFPGVLWAFRNLYIMKTLFSEGVTALSQQSILNNLSNPQFVDHISAVTKLVILLSIFTLAAVFWKKLSLSWVMVLTYLLLAVSFLINPAVLVINQVRDQAFIEWRFGLALLAYLYILLAVIAAPLAVSVYQNLFSKTPLAVSAQLITVLIAGFLLVQHNQYLKVNPKNAIVLQDQFRESVGVDGYHSAYDYIQQNITNSIIRVENGLPFYTYGPGYTNYPTKVQYPLGQEDLVLQLNPQYFLIFNRDGEIPDYVQTDDFLTKWELIYQDPEGNLFIRKESP